MTQPKPASHTTCTTHTIDDGTNTTPPQTTIFKAANAAYDAYATLRTQNQNPQAVDEAKTLCIQAAKHLAHAVQQLANPDPGTQSPHTQTPSPREQK